VKTRLVCLYAVVEVPADWTDDHALLWAGEYERSYDAHVLAAYLRDGYDGRFSPVVGCDPEEIETIREGDDDGHQATRHTAT